MRFYPLDKLINLHDDYSRQFKIDNHQLLLIQRLGERFLIEAHCPHRGHPLASASLVNRSIECSQHHYQFSLDDGSLLQAREEPCRGLRTFEIVYQGNEIGVILDEESAQD